MIEEGLIPLPFLQTGWTTHFSEYRVTSDHAWPYLHANTSSFRQAHRGWALKEEGYVKNLKLNVNTADPALGIIRAKCTPSMKSGIYVVTTWFTKAVGDIAGAHCECVAGLSETCQHVAGLLLSVADLADDKGMEVACTDLSCKWIVPAEAKKPAPRLPLVEISYRKYRVNKPLRQKKATIQLMQPPVVPNRKSSGAFQGEPRAMLPQPPSATLHGATTGTTCT
ncbi:hypothetical protein HPB49_023957 [Dermacentor silvarum]|uniref:Uncharacterized protein n=1 Tax=Dermacentor silvarum TaxID=543639 RepID=A0ACB8CI54_DERSI|nr:hypothetical protein HPB49_023957 [Dermacentor silvarum]